MSYLNLPSLDLADFQSGVISLWFRFSDDTVTSAAPYQSEKSHPNAPDILNSTMPLVTFGRKVAAKVYDNKGKTFTQEIPGGKLTASVPQVEEIDGEFFCAPSHIGIICGNSPQLVMKFQTDTRAAVAGLNAQITNVTWSLDPAGGGYNMHRTIEETSYVQVGEPESFLIVPRFGVDVDQWHHLLVSFDFSTDVNVVAVKDHVGSAEELRRSTIKSFCRVWLAFDDENKSGKENIGDNEDLAPGSEQPPHSGWVPMDENGIIPQNAEAAVRSYTKAEPATDSAGNKLDDNRVTSTGEYHWAAVGLPAQGGAMGFPASAEYEQTIYHCEMADFQFFSGVTLDTSDESSRRAFIDQDGKPVPPSNSGGSIELLGQRPDILLFRSGNWKRGKNTGSTGTTDDGEEIPEGQFEPTALIASYKPNPSLYGPQNPGET